MKIVLATPLYPPDIGGASAYCKELARRLSKSHEVTVLTYARSPEELPSVRTISIEKRRPLFIRLSIFLLKTLTAIRRADVLYIENGASVELPASIAASFARKRLVLHIGDVGAHRFAQTRRVYSLIERFSHARARVVIEDSPPPRPEILPFGPRPEAELAAYETAWQDHLAAVEKTLYA